MPALPLTPAGRADPGEAGPALGVGALPSLQAPVTGRCPVSLLCCPLRDKRPHGPPYLRLDVWAQLMPSLRSAAVNPKALLGASDCIPAQASEACSLSLMGFL